MHSTLLYLYLWRLWSQYSLLLKNLKTVEALELAIRRSHRLRLKWYTRRLHSLPFMLGPRRHTGCLFCAVGHLDQSGSL